jgi:hypothetical protein
VALSRRRSSRGCLAESARGGGRRRSSGISSRRKIRDRPRRRRGCVDKERQIGWVELGREAVVGTPLLASDESDGAWAWPARHEALTPTGPLIRHPPSSPQDGCLLGQSPGAQPELGRHDNECVIAPRLSACGLAHCTRSRPGTADDVTRDNFAQFAVQVVAVEKIMSVGGGFVYFAPEIETVQQKGFSGAKSPVHISLFFLDKTRPSSPRLIIAEQFIITLRLCSQHINMTTVRNMVFESALASYRTSQEPVGPVCRRKNERRTTISSGRNCSVARG